MSHRKNHLLIRLVAIDAGLVLRGLIGRGGLAVILHLQRRAVTSSSIERVLRSLVHCMCGLLRRCCMHHHAAKHMHMFSSGHHAGCRHHVLLSTIDSFR